MTIYVVLQCINILSVNKQPVLKYNHRQITGTQIHHKLFVLQFVFKCPKRTICRNKCVAAAHRTRLSPFLSVT